MDATATPYLNELLASWCLLLASFPLIFLVVRTIKETNYEDEKTVYVDDLKREQAAVKAQPVQDGANLESQTHEKESIPDGRSEDAGV